MTSSASVSVCIPTRNQSGYIRDTLESVLQQ
jgi:glycosyltransferase involved in cell wall biosynthesis